MNDEAVSKLIEKLEGWRDAAILHLPNFLVAVVVLVLFAVLGRLVRHLLVRLLDRMIPTQIARLTGSIVYLILLVVGLFVALGSLGLQKTVTSLLAGAGIVGLALGFAFQDLAANFVSGIVLAVRRPFSLGEIIETNDIFGTVDKISLRSTDLRTPQGQMARIPNRLVFENPLINFSTTGLRRIDLDVGVSYGDDLERAKELALEAVRGISPRREDREPELFYKEFGDSSINFVVRFWVDYRRQPDYLSARSEAVMRIKRAFDDNGITIPFPIRTLDFGIVGGERLATSLAEVPGIGGRGPGGSGGGKLTGSDG